MSVPHVAIDTESDAAYVFLVPEIEDDEAAQSLVVEVPGGEVTIDLDEEGRILGFEVVGAAALLRPETLEDAEDVTD